MPTQKRAKWDGYQAVSVARELVMRNSFMTEYATNMTVGAYRLAARWLLRRRERLSPVAHRARPTNPDNHAPVIESPWVKGHPMAGIRSIAAAIGLR
jgi:hypothetical protein